MYVDVYRFFILLLVFLFVVIPLIYLLILGIPRKTYQTTTFKKFQPFCSLILPIYNEGAAIIDRINNIFSTTYPQDKFELIIIDDSTDETSEILKSFVDEQNYTNIKLIVNKIRGGYANAIRNGIKSASYDFIVLVDGGSRHYKDTIPNLMKYFQLTEIGGVGAKIEIQGENDQTLTQERNYRSIYQWVRDREALLDSTFHVNGEAFAFRKSLVKDLKW